MSHGFRGPTKTSFHRTLCLDLLSMVRRGWRTGSKVVDPDSQQRQVRCAQTARTPAAKPKFDTSLHGEKNHQEQKALHQLSTHDMSDSEGELGIFEEPEGFYEPEKEPSFVDYTLQNGLKLNLRLVGHNPLWVSLHCLFLLTYAESP